MKAQEIIVELIDRRRLMEAIKYNAFIGGEERPLSKTEILALIEKERVWNTLKIPKI